MDSNIISICPTCEKIVNANQAHNLNICLHELINTRKALREQVVHLENTVAYLKKCLSVKEVETNIVYGSPGDGECDAR